MNTYIIERAILYKVQDSNLKSMILTTLELRVSLQRFRTYRENYPDGHLTGCEVGRVEMNLPKKHLDKYVSVMRMGCEELQRYQRRQLDDLYDELEYCRETGYYSSHDRQLLEIFCDYLNGNYDSWYPNDEELKDSIMADINNVK